MQMSVIFLCPFMDDSALLFIRATNLTWEETDLKRQAPLELCRELTKSTLSVFINRCAYAQVGLPDSDLSVCVLLLGKLLRKHLTLCPPRSHVLCCLEEQGLPDTALSTRGSVHSGGLLLHLPLGPRQCLCACVRDKERQKAHPFTWCWS